MALQHGAGEGPLIEHEYLIDGATVTLTAAGSGVSGRWLIVVTIADRDDQHYQLSEEIGPDTDDATMNIVSDLVRGHRNTAGLTLASEALVRARRGLAE